MSVELNMDTKSEYDTLVQQYKGKDIAECFANMHLSFRRELDVVRQSVTAVETRVSELEKFATHANIEINNFEPKIKENVQEERSERLKLDLWSRKWNLVIRGLRGQENENPREVIKLCKNFFIDTLKLPRTMVDEMTFQAGHRLPGKFQGVNNIIIRFVNLIDRDDVMSAAMKLAPGSGYSVTPDLPPSVALLRSKLLKERSQLPPNEKKMVKLVYRKQEPFVELVRRKLINIEV
ncbi:hypothetical protein FSP39_003732 [Pinctada imbricata]|uniref:Uncharacterized protein n=1 Tax=Pinctada imbricata TaxID=66713 RepID=A0AA89C522_PINIB|nr:hypothetical protein FSP39_003732 [Pinctada imbricata]